MDKNKLIENMLTTTESNYVPGTLTQLDEFRNAVTNYAYTYKPESGENPDIVHMGVMAQDLLNVPGFEEAVIQNEDGTLGVDVNKAVLPLIGLVSDLAKEVQTLRGLLMAV